MCQKVIPSASLTPQGKKQMNAAFFPFCSERCRLIDLGAWLDEDYRLPSNQNGSSFSLSEE
jgi:endogenous inhibitor of DNA gyrase (YacG/DUF329 family)